VLFKPTRRFREQVLADSKTSQKRIFRTLKKLVRDPWAPGVNLEPITGRKGFWTARVTLGCRLLLREVEPDEKKQRVFHIIGYGTHEEIYW